MNSDAEELEDLAEMLDRKARWSTARAAMAPHDATVNPQKEAVNIAYCRRKAEVCRRAAKILAGPKPPRNKALACAPTAEEWDAYAAELKWPVRDARACFDHFQSQGWRIGGKAVVKDWKAAARNGHRRWLEKHPGSAPKPAEATPDPAGWTEWLKANGMPYTAHQRAMPGTRKAFETSGK